MVSTMGDAYIYDAVRTPRGKGRASGSLHSAEAVELVTTLIAALGERLGSDTVSTVDDVILGVVSPVGEQGADIARTAVLRSGINDRIPGVQLNRFCASGLEAVNQAAARVRGGDEHLFLAGGVESMSRVAMGSDGGPWMATDTRTAPPGFVPQGVSADLIASIEGFTREDVDAYAVESQRRAAVAREQGRFAHSLIPVTDDAGALLLAEDEHPRPGTSLDSLAALPPAFEELGTRGGFDAVAQQKYPEVTGINHVHHAGNSSGIVDGSALVVVGSETAGKRHGLTPRARILSTAVVGDEPTIMLTAPGPASELALARAGLRINDLDVVEVNEAFAAIPLKLMRDLGISHDLVNPNGGAIALGHPLGATGAILVGTVLDELERIGGRYGLVTLCAGGGMGIATIIERIERS